MVGIAGLSIAGSTLLDKWRKKTLRVEEPMDATVHDQSTKKGNKLFGCICAATLALTNGSMLAPIQFAGEQAQSINFIVSFGIGVLAITPIFATIYFTALRKMPNWDLEHLLLPGILCGLMWNIGNGASIYATNSLGFTVGFPLAQCALLVGGFWGIVLFKEITGFPRIALYVCGCFVLLGGAVLLALYGKQ